MAENKYALSGKKLEAFLDEIYIYFLLEGETIVYVGQTVNLKSRLKEHSKNKTFDRVEYFFTSKTKPETDLLEAVLILKHLPKYNKSLPVAPKEVGLTKESDLPKCLSKTAINNAYKLTIRDIKYYDSSTYKDGLLKEWR